MPTSGAQRQPQQQQAAPAFPSKPIRFIVPFSAGSGTDIAARASRRGSRSLARPVVIENRPGAGSIAAAAATKAN
ncbi:MAG: hypothetical protein U1F49_11100 [Rubrivivax sp.]